jgi:predicted aconitase
VRAPDYGLHRDANRHATLLLDCSSLDPHLLAEDALYPVLGAWLGRMASGRVAAFAGLPRDTSEDRLKALGAASASSGAIGLFHVVGVTPEAPDIATVFGGVPPAETIALSGPMLRESYDRLSTTSGTRLDAIAIGSPHLSLNEVKRLLTLLDGRPSRLPFYACTGRHTLSALEREGLLGALGDANITIVADTCVVVAPILPDIAGAILLTNSGKFAHYTRPNTGYDVVFGSLSDVAESAAAGRLVRDRSLWS